MQRPRPERPLYEVALNAKTLRLQRANLAVLIAAFRVATLRVVEAVQRWQAVNPKVLMYRPRAAGGPAVRPTTFTLGGRNLLHALLFDEAQQLLPLPLRTDPLLLRCFGAGRAQGEEEVFRAEALHAAADLRRMRRADDALRSEARFHGLAVLAPRPATTDGPAYAELELLLHGAQQAFRAALPRFNAREELYDLERAVTTVQAVIRGKRARRAVAKEEEERRKAEEQAKLDAEVERMHQEALEEQRKHSEADEQAERRQLEEEEEGILGRRSREGIQLGEEEEERRQQDLAAVGLQKVVRGAGQRRQLKRERAARRATEDSAASRMAAARRGQLGRRRVERKRAAVAGERGSAALAAAPSSPSSASAVVGEVAAPPTGPVPPVGYARVLSE